MIELGEYDITPRPPMHGRAVRALAWCGLLEPDAEDWPLSEQYRVLARLAAVMVGTVALTLFFSLGLPWLLAHT